MSYYDPYRRRFVAEADAQTEALSEGVVLVRSRDPDAPWFVHETWTATSHRIEDFGEAEDVVRGLAQATVARVELRERLLQRCDDVRGLDQAPPMDDAEAREILWKALRENLGLDGVEAAVAASLKAGFRAQEIALALHTLQDQPTLSDALDGVEVVSVSQLVERRAQAD